MQVTRQQINPTKVKLTISASQIEIDKAKQSVLRQLKQNVKVPGFRQGKAPEHMIEKQLDPTQYQTEFLETAVNDLYVAAVQSENLRPADQPEVTISKFVPFTTLEFTAEVEVVGEIKLADYKNIKLSIDKPEVTAKDVNEVIENLRQRSAVKKTVTRPVKQGDEAIIDFKGVDAATKEEIAGASGNDYPLIIGSKTFIPGFEPKIVGMKPGDTKTFTITFPEDYGAKSLQNRKVSFTVSVKQVQEVTKAKLDDAFAASVGPFKTVSELKADVKKQLKAEKQQDAQRNFDNQLLEALAEQSTVAIPDSLIEEEVDRIEEEEKRNVVYRGQTWQEHLREEGMTAEQHRQKNRPAAELRVKGGLVLSEVASKEQISVTPEEFEIRMQLLRGQYPDPAMQAELDKPENRRDIMSRMLTEKTLDRLRDYSIR